jgi:hypothetical protein
MIILLQRPNLPKVNKALSTDFKPSNDDRRKLLALMNCVYETQNPSLFKRITFVRQTLNESSDIYAKRSLLPLSTKENPDIESNSDRIQCNVELPLAKLDLYPTDCLSIAFLLGVLLLTMMNVYILCLQSWVQRNEGISIRIKGTSTESDSYT